MTIGKKLSPILAEIGLTILESQTGYEIPPNYDNISLMDASIIFQSVLLDRMWKMQEKENMPFDSRCNMATKAGEDLRKLIKTYCDIDMHNINEVL
jgi:hypothetical protein